MYSNEIFSPIPIKDKKDSKLAPLSSLSSLRSMRATPAWSSGTLPPFSTPKLFTPSPLGVSPNATVKVPRGHVPPPILPKAYPPPGTGHKLAAKRAAGSTPQSSTVPFKNDYSNHYIHSGVLPVKYIRNASQQVVGYPKLQKLNRLKERQIKRHATKPFGARVRTCDLVKTLNSWAYNDHLQFDVIMIGALSENQLLYPVLSQLPIDKLCAKPGFLFIWASTQKISELSELMKDRNCWTRRFRRSEELIFMPVDKNSPYYPADCNIPEKQVLEEFQWHCWMCITGTVRRSTDRELIHCNINTDLAIESDDTGNSAVPSQIYKVAENFSNSTRRLHIIPASSGLDHPVKVRPGWVVVSPDVILDNFNAHEYQKELNNVGMRIPLTGDIEQLRPKTPN